MIFGLEPFHVGVVSSDFDADRAVLANRFGVPLGDPIEAVMHLRAAHGAEYEIPLRSAWARTGCMFLEITRAQPGSIWQGNGAHHVGVWAQDLEALTARAIDAGATLELDGSLPGETEVMFRYLWVPPGLRVELVSERIRPMIEGL